MIVVVAEKPSVARDIAAFLGAQKKDGYFQGNGYQVTWAFGHLVGLQEPEDYDPSWKKWSLDTLPIIPKQFALKLLGDAGARKQFGVIKALLEKAQEIICATDAGREGELIFRYILSLSKLEHRDFKRLWLSSLTEEAMGKAFAALKPGSDYNLLYQAARCRSESDWIVGLNATRNFTIRYGRGGILCSVGRVQTPVLAMVVARDDEIRHFVSKPFWELKTAYRGTQFRWKGDRFYSQEEGQKVLESILGFPLTVESVESKQEKVLPPLLFDLTDLQQEMNKKHGLSANDTLQIAQGLYEGKLISYPRTDSKFLTSDMKEEVGKILPRLQLLFAKELGALDLQALPFNARIINDKKTTDHHAIIPTGKISQTLQADELKVFRAIALRFIAVFYPPCIKGVTTVQGVVNSRVFLAKGVRIVDPGWTVLYDKEGKDSEEEQELPVFVKGETGPHEPYLKEGKTEPPRHFTEASLLNAMETAGKSVEDEALKEALKQKGLGTPATRAAIIEILLKRGYIVREKKNVLATDLGRYLIANIRNPQLKSAELTGEWEAKLKHIEQGKVSSELFMEQIIEYTKQIMHIAPSLPQLGSCPLCGRHIIEGKRGIGCSGWKEGCKFALLREYKGVVLRTEDLQELVQQKVLQKPVYLSSGPVVMYLSAQGVLLDVPLPQVEKKTYVAAKKPEGRLLRKGGKGSGGARK